MKHQRIIKISLTLGSENSGVCLKPFKKSDFELDKSVFHDTVNQYGVVLSRRIIEIVEKIKSIRKLK
ncbi:hypothetical protein H7X64_02280, partial [Armatimonadetes bacterium]|nr:hypothetical protein [bacterium]